VKVGVLCGERDGCSPITICSVDGEGEAFHAEKRSQSRDIGGGVDVNSIQ
jgi:hypothetical protein